MTTISAKSVLASRHALDKTKRIDTLLLRYPRCIHAEFMTHRMFSRNTSSSRAIPVKKLIKDVLNDPFVPLFWGKNQKGMQASEECNDPVGNGTKEAAWLEARDHAVEIAECFEQAGYHKQIVNRLLEPFSHITVVVTATNWSNFLALRDHPDAEPHIQILAREIRKAIEDAEVQTLQPGDWHLPFITYEDHDAALIYGNTVDGSWLETIKKLSVARCASTSYKTVEGFDMTLERAKALYDKLANSSPGHMSPFEHQAQADQIAYSSSSDEEDDVWDCSELSGNLGPGWIQLRKTMPNECL